MTLDQANELLKVAQRFDRRTIGEGDIEGWFTALYGLDFDPCAAAVVYHYGRETDFIMPAHVRRLATPATPQGAYQLPSNPSRKADYWRERGDQDTVLWADKCAGNKALVCRYPDIAEKLAQFPYKGTPEGWSGFIPGTDGPLGVREQLLALVREAAERADAGEAERDDGAPATALPESPWARDQRKAAGHADTDHAA